MTGRSPADLPLNRGLLNRFPVLGGNEFAMPPYVNQRDLDAQVLGKNRGAGPKRDDVANGEHAVTIAQRNSKRNSKMRSAGLRNAF